MLLLTCLLLPVKCSYLTCSGKVPRPLCYASSNLIVIFRSGAAHGNCRHQKPRDQQCSALQQLSGEQHRALLLSQEGEKEQGEEEEVDQSRHRHAKQLPVSCRRPSAWVRSRVWTNMAIPLERSLSFRSLLHSA